MTALQDHDPDDRRQPDPTSRSRSRSHRIKLLLRRACYIQIHATTKV